MPEQQKLESFQVESDTNAGTWYTLSEQVDGTWKCNCPGFFHRERCKHLKRVNDED